MRGRKRQRKKNEKRRGVYGLAFVVTLKRQRDQVVADYLAKLISHRYEQNREQFFQGLLAAAASPQPPFRASEILKVRLGEGEPDAPQENQASTPPPR